MISGLNNSSAQSSIKVLLADGTPFNVAVDGRYFNKRGTSVTVGDLPPGRHFVQIYSVNRNRRGRGREEVIYEGKVRTTEGMVSILAYDPYSRRTDIQEQDLATYMSAHPQTSPMNGYNNSNQGYINNQGLNSNPNNNQGNTNNQGSYQPAPSATGSMSDSKIDQLKTNVAAKNTDTEKEKFLKEQLKDEKLTTSQVGTMMDWFNFESSKVDFAEWAFAITVDKDAFSSLEAKFTYKNYQDELDNFLKTK